MATIHKFLGKRVEVPEDRNYYASQGIWTKAVDRELLAGLTEPALVLMGGLNGLDWLVSEGQRVDQDQAVIFAITGKILYLNSPVKGVIHFNDQVKQDVDLVLKSPYDQGWLFKIKPHPGSDKGSPNLIDAQAYLESLKGTEGFKNPDGLKGGVSGICKAVYSGIRDQKI